MSTKSTFQAARLTLVLALLLGAVFVPTQTARALAFTVNTTADTNDAAPGNGVCADASGQCSLRAAITEANATAGTDTITLPAGTYQLTRANAGGVNEDGNSTGDLDINSSLTITGAGSGSTFIQAGTNTSDGIDKVLGVNPYCASSVSVTIQDVTIRYGRNTQPYGAPDFSYTGGGLDWCGGMGSDSFTLQNAVVSDNTAVNGYGGGVNIDSISPYTGTITIDNVTFQNNSTTSLVNEAHGGALNIFGNRPNVTITDSTFTNNQVASSTSKGGAIYLRLTSGGSLQIHNSLIDGNTTNGDGGGIAVDSWNVDTTVTIDQNTRIMNNTAGRYGGGIYLYNSTGINTTPYFLSHLLISGNTATGDPGGGIYIGGINATVQYSRIVNNTASSGTGLQKVSPSGTVTAERNWWGCSGGPGAAGCDTAVVTGGTLDFNPWLQGRFTANPTTLSTGQTSILELSFLKASDNSDISPSNLNQIAGLAVNWLDTPDLGTITGEPSIQTNGKAIATFTATGTGTTLLSAQVDQDATGSGTSTVSVLVVNPPTVTINKAAGQLDPTNTGPINFTVVFSEPVTGFGEATDVTLGGTAPGTLSKTITEIAPNNGTTFNVEVSGMTGSGTVTASVPAGVAQNASAVPNAVSTSTDNSVIYDVTPPETSITGNPTDPSNSATAEFTFSGTDTGGAGVSSFECQLDGGGFSACTSPKQYTGLADSPHTFHVFAWDAAGNADASPAAYTWTVDTTVATTTTLGSNTNPSSYTWPVTFTATVAPAPTGGTVEFRDGGVTIPGCAAQALTGGQATCATSALAVGSHNITAVYSGATSFLSSTSAPLVQVVNQQNTSLLLTSSVNPSYPTQSVTFTANLRCCGAPGTPLAGEQVTFKDGETIIGTGTTDSSGNATFSTADLSAGTHSITAVFAGSANFLGSTSNSVSQSVQQITTGIELTSGTNPSTYGQSVTFTATVRCCGAPGSPVEGVNVTFKDGETVLGTDTTDASGVATFRITTLTTGSHSITAVFAGSAIYQGSTSSPIVQVVNRVHPQVFLSSSVNPSYPTQSVTFTATVDYNAGFRVVGEQVTFYDGEVPLGTRTTNGIGQATFTISELALGSHSITAAYPGSVNLELSTSSTVTQVVAAIVTQTSILSAIPNPSAVGQSVTFTAHVDHHAGYPVVGVEVTFKDGETVIATAITDENGIATFSTSSLAAGSHSITAVFAGTSAYQGSTSSPLTQVVDGTAPVVLSITRLSSNPTKANAVNFSVTFSEPVTGVNAADFQLATTGTLSGASIAYVSGTGATRTVTVSTGGPGAGTLGLNLVDNDSVRDAVNQPLGSTGAGNGSFTGEVYTVDKEPPSVVSIARLSGNPTRANAVNFRLTFSEAVTGISAADFQLATTGTLSGASIAYVSGTGTIRTVTVNTGGAGAGTLGLNLGDDDSIKDSLNNPLGGTGAGNGDFTGDVYTVDRTPPTVVSIVKADADPTSAAVVHFTVTFTEAVFNVDSADFNLTLTGISGAAITGVTGTGATRTITVNTGTGSGTLGLNLADNDSIKDWLGNPLAGAGNGSFVGEVYTVR